MANDTATKAPASGETAPDAGAPVSGSYDLLRRRLTGQLDELAATARQLDERRVGAYGAVAVQLAASDRLTTDLACTPRDIARVGDTLIVGYNTSLELSEPQPEHTFALYRADTAAPALTAVAADDPANFLADTAFRVDFAKLHKFYGKARFADLRVAGGQLLAVFQVGDRVEDIQVLRWAVHPDGTVTYIDARGDRDYTWPDAHDLEWHDCTREDQRAGAYPVFSVLDEVFVGFRDGRLQLRVEDGSGGTRAAIDEPVTHPNQSLTDVAVRYATAGDVLTITVAVYNEPERSYVFSRRTRTGSRVDAAGRSSRVLPGGDGILFCGGYHLNSTGTRTFDVDTAGHILEETVVSPNGEDVLYVYHRRSDGAYLLMPYNLVRREVANVIVCHGYAIFDNGAMVLFRGADHDADPARTHAIQWWQTPYTAADWAAEASNDDTWAARVGNAALVAGIGATFEIDRIGRTATPTERTFETLVGAVRRTLDTNLWIGDPETSGLDVRLNAVAETAGQLLDEYANRERRRAAAARELTDVRRLVAQTTSDVTGATTPAAVVAGLGEIRRARAAISAAGDVELIDVDALDGLGAQLDAAAATLTGHAVVVLDDATAFAGTQTRIEEIERAGEAAADSAALDKLTVELDGLGGDLDAVVDTVSALESGDATARTRIVRHVADVTGALNRARARISARLRELSDTESAAAFDAEVTLVEQTLNGSVANTTTPDECDQVLARMLVTIERLDSRYGDDPERSAKVAELRDAAHETVTSRRNALLDERNRRVSRVAAAAERLLATITRRAGELSDDHEIAAYFATDQMPARVRELAVELSGLGDESRCAEIESGLRDAAEQARRRIRDRAALNDDDGAVVLGGYRLAQNNQPFEIVLTTHDGRVAATITGTEYRRDVTGQLAEFSDLLEATYPSETDTVSRSEYLAWAVIADAEARGDLAGLIADCAAPEQLARRCTTVAEARHHDGYQRGVHDADAARILAAVAGQLAAEPLLRHTGTARAYARLWWAATGTNARAGWLRRAAGAATAASLFSAHGPADRLRSDLNGELAAMFDGHDPRTVAAAAAYLADQLAVDDQLIAASTAVGLAAEFAAAAGPAAEIVGESIDAEETIVAKWRQARDWVAGFAANAGGGSMFDVDEAAALIACERLDDAPAVRTAAQTAAVTVGGLAGDHRRIVAGTLTTRLDELAAAAGARFVEMESRWPAYVAARRAVVDTVGAEVRLDEHRPKVMAGFVRNQLIDTALLPLFGSNLARQLGTVDANDTARQGLLVVVSPPGYGKTTLMEWIAERLGLLLVKVNGPALGTDTTSLDPAQAPNAAARAELEKINLAFQMGRNVMLYLDDIQHTSATFLSRFIPLADATRRIEGVVDGEPRTFDLRGKRFCVVMAGNPYTSGGGRFEMPDMLVNRSDVFNLGDVTGEHSDAFAMSYLENSVTACGALAPFASRLLDDLARIDEMAAGRIPIDASGLEHAWDGNDLASTVTVVAKLRRVRDVLLAVNGAYIASASQTESDRDAPPFLLQGSYRNMARIASNVVAVMTDRELDAAVDGHYQAEAQTLTDRAEQNLLAYKMLAGRADDAERARWGEIVARWAERVAAANPAGQIVAAVDRLAAAVDRDDQPPVWPAPRNTDR